MLMPHPETLRKLVQEYEAVVAQEAAEGTGRPGRRAQDLAYTLCVSTGTRDVRSALAEARRQLAAATAPAPSGAPSAPHGTSTGRRLIRSGRKAGVSAPGEETAAMSD
ncbi:DUF5133 domain-containing protein [Streptomyces sp. NPDC058371]|uniref:DUF5133 domain-containing protein n=1 Tax=Streptomyces sp. NPDC058371 TaxID=3346463 RepID=UPI00364627F2